MARTTTRGKTWSSRRLPDYVGSAGMACPSFTTCYVAAGFTVLKTSDGFNHARETLAHSAIHDVDLGAISCPTATSCYASGTRTACPGGGGCHPVGAPFAVTSDGGRTWRAMPNPPDPFARLSCPSPSVCYATSPFSCCSPGTRDAAVYRTGDGAKTWQRKTVRQIVAPLAPDPDSQAPDISCVTAATCYVVTQLLNPKQTAYTPILSLLVTRNGGTTWSVRTGINVAVRAGVTNRYAQPTLDVISCPSVMTCFAVGSTDARGASSGAVLLATADGGKTWRRHSLPSGGRRGPLACPSVTTCAELLEPLPSMRLPATLAAVVLVTHDAGIRWHRTVFSTHHPLMGIACATAQACRVASEEDVYGTDSIFGTEDGGRTWQRQLMANGKGLPYLASVARPAVDTCYAVGGVIPNPFDDVAYSSEQPRPCAQPAPILRRDQRRMV